MLATQAQGYESSAEGLGESTPPPPRTSTAGAAVIWLFLGDGGFVRNSHNMLTFLFLDSSV